MHYISGFWNDGHAQFSFYSTYNDHWVVSCSFVFFFLMVRLHVYSSHKVNTTKQLVATTKYWNVACIFSWNFNIAGISNEETNCVKIGQYFSYLFRVCCMVWSLMIIIGNNIMEMILNFKWHVKCICILTRKS